MTNPVINVSIETIQGELYTVVWHDYIVTEPLKELSSNWHKNRDGYVALWPHGVIATALPALPRKPKPEDAQLLYRYMAEGIEPCWERELRGAHLILEIEEGNDEVEITHALNLNGNKIEIAIKEDE
jgi:hypothetical protein